jgi:hypothetical protein
VSFLQAPAQDQLKSQWAIALDSVSFYASLFPALNAHINISGAINFFFGLPAIKSIDTIGRRKWLLTTLPLMAVFMLGAALAFMIDNPSTRTGIVAVFLFREICH